MSTTYHSLASGNLTQNWSNAGLITTNDDWSGVPSITGYLGDIDAGSATNVDPRTLTGAASGAVDVIANQTNPDTNTTGGVAEFAIADPTVALQGSGTADAPALVLYLDASDREGVRVQFNARDIDGSADDAAQQLNVQYRVGASGAWTNVTGGYFADVTTAGTATQVTAVDVTLPAAANNQAQVQVRILTTNAGGSDEWVGIDDIDVSSVAVQRRRRTRRRRRCCPPIRPTTPPASSCRPTSCSTSTRRCRPAPATSPSPTAPAISASSRWAPPTRRHGHVQRQPGHHQPGQQPRRRHAYDVIVAAGAIEDAPATTSPALRPTPSTSRPPRPPRRRSTTSRAPATPRPSSARRWRPRAS